MRVTLRASEGESQPDRACRVDPVYNFLVAELFGVGAAFLIDEGVAVES